MTEQISCVGFYQLSRSYLERLAQGGNQVNIHVIGWLTVGPDVSAELLGRTVQSLNLRGRLRASAEAQVVLEQKRS